MTFCGFLIASPFISSERLCRNSQVLVCMCTFIKTLIIAQVKYAIKTTFFVHTYRQAFPLNVYPWNLSVTFLSDQEMGRKCH